MQPVGDPAAARWGGLRFFLAWVAAYYVVVAIAGFAPSYLDFAAGSFPIEPIVHVHGAIMAAWLGLLIAQTVLAARGDFRRHRQLGLASTGLAALVWAGMWVLSVNAIHRDKPPIDSFLYDVLLAQLSSIVLFAVFFVWGFQARRNAASHRRLMILATAVLLQAAVDRIPWLPDFGIPGFWGHTFWLVIVTVSPLVIFDLLTLRRVHPVTLAGIGVIVVVHLACALLWKNPAWHAFAFALTAPLRQ